MNWKSNLIILGAILTSTPRWIIALLSAEGITIPSGWMQHWIFISALLAGGMAFVEGLAFAYTFQAWRSQRGKASDTLLGLVLAAGLSFVVVLSVSMAANVRGQTLHEFIPNTFLLLVWTSCVALSTILIVIAVGYSERVIDVDPELQKLRQELRDARKELKQTEQAKEWAWLWNGSTKAEKISQITARWPDLSGSAIAQISGASETYVSQQRNR